MEHGTKQTGNVAEQGAAHTPGDWQACIWGKELKGYRRDAHHAITTTVNGVIVTICEVPITADSGMMRPDGKGGSKEYASYKIRKAEAIRNVRLLAAAPDLLEAAIVAKAIFGRDKWQSADPDSNLRALRKLNAAIAKLQWGAP